MLSIRLCHTNHLPTCICMYIYMYMYMCIYMYIYVYVYIYLYTIHICVCTHTNVYVYRMILCSWIKISSFPFSLFYCILLQVYHSQNRQLPSRDSFKEMCNVYSMCMNSLQIGYSTRSPGYYSYFHTLYYTQIQTHKHKHKHTNTNMQTQTQTHISTHTNKLTHTQTHSHTHKHRWYGKWAHSV